MIQYGKHNIIETDIEAVCDVLRNHHLTQGAKGLEFEEALCKYTGAAHAVTVNSGTSALHIACLALNIGEKDLVWTVPNSFVASANCALYCGAEIDFVDIDVDSRNIDTQALQAKLYQAKQRGRLPKAVILVHFAGLSCEMKLISEILKPFDQRASELFGIGRLAAKNLRQTCGFAERGDSHIQPHTNPLPETGERVFSCLNPAAMP